MKQFFEMVAMLFGSLWAMRTKEQARQYEYDNGEGEIE